VDLSGVLKGVCEENQRHWRVLEIIVFKHFIHLFTHFGIIAKVGVQPRVFDIRVGRICHSVISKQDGVDHDLLLYVREELRDQIREKLIHDKGLVFLTDEAISKYSHTFVTPKPD